jgi:hypothetical protein
MRTEEGTQDFLALRSYIATAVKHSITILETLSLADQPQPMAPRPTVNSYVTSTHHYVTSTHHQTPHPPKT